MCGYWFTYLNGKTLLLTSRGKVGPRPVEVAVMGGDDLTCLGRGMVEKADLDTFHHLMVVRPTPLRQAVLFYRNKGQWERLDCTPNSRLAKELAGSSCEE